ncbi:MAG: outer membrane protein assembly factor BamE [Pseudomonadota bacterium]
MTLAVCRAQVMAGMGEDEVRMALGSPATTSQTANGRSYYYISSTMTQQAFFKPKEVDRKVVAVYFSPLGTVTRVANYGLKDGRVFDYIARETPSANNADETIIQQLFRNLGRRTLTTQS